MVLLDVRDVSQDQQVKSCGLECTQLLKLSLGKPVLLEIGLWVR